MEISKDRYTNTSDFEGESGEATVNLSQLSLFVGNMISNYNFPEIATFREWVSNAHDSHVRTGQTRPIEVVLPSMLQPTFSVKDCGIGMSGREVIDVYLDFGSSTKRDDNTGIGGFGQGGKSALAIASQYTMSAVKDGLKNVFIFERSASGGVAYKRVINDVPTDEENGILVSVSVDRPEQFTDQNVNRVLAGWSNSQVKIMNRPNGFFSIPDNGTEVEFTLDCTNSRTTTGELDLRVEHGYVLHGALDPADSGKSISKELGLGWREYAVLVGPVAYTFEPAVINAAALPDYMVASVNIGDVTFPSSREVIEPNRSNRDFVGKVLDKIVTEADKLMQKRADSLSSRADALQLFRSPLARNRNDFKVSYLGDSIPTTFEVNGADVIFEYKHVGNWQGVKNFQLSATQYTAGQKLPLDIEMLVILDSDVTDQSIRNNVRLFHTDREDKPGNLKGYLQITKDPSEWVKAAAKTVIKSTELAEKAKEIRIAIREGKKSGVVAGTNTPSPRRSRRDRLGEYSSSYLDFTTDANGKDTVEIKRVDLIDFYDDVFDPSKRLVLVLRGDDYGISDFAPYFKSFSVRPDNAQFLQIDTGSKIETLRILLGDEVEILTLKRWMEQNFAKLATFGSRIPSEIAKEIPVRMSNSEYNIVSTVGEKNLHPKMQEIVKLNKELDDAMQKVNGYSYSARFVRNLFDGDELRGQGVENRHEFYFLTSSNYYSRGNFTEDAKVSMIKMINAMVELWIANIAAEDQAKSDKEALEEAEAEESLDENSDSNISTYVGS